MIHRRVLTTAIGITCSLALLAPALGSADQSWPDDPGLRSCPARTMISADPTAAADLTLLRTVHGAFALDPEHGLTLPGGHLLLQLAAPLDATTRSLLEDLGVALLQYLPQNSWRVSIPQASLAAVRSLDATRALVPLCPLDKLAPELLRRGFAPRCLNPDGTLTVEVTFSADVPFETALDSLRQIEAATEQDSFVAGSRISVTLDEQDIPRLLASDVVQWVESRAAPEAEDNANAAALSRVDEVQAPPFNLDGSGVIIGEWDGGEVQSGHPDFGGRVTVMNFNGVSSHSTHVAGTMIGDGSGNPGARGMAPAATLYSYDYQGDELAEMAAARTAFGIMFSSNSWGVITGWHWNYYSDGYYTWFGDEAFGAYTARTQSWDQTVIATGLIITKSAGNDRDDDGDQDQTGHRHYQDQATVYYDYHPPDGDYDCVGQIASAKNVLTVGALTDSALMTDFSSWGPCDDGRVKPDITANGDALLSTCPTDTYCVKSGTSMSTPTAAGAMALVYQDYVQRVAAEGPSAALMKALIINTASDLDSVGPDYATGWGLLDARAAIDTVLCGGHCMTEVELVDSEVVELELAVAPGTDALRVTIAWTDPPGDPLAAWALVNDVDLELQAPGATIHQPWVLNPASPATPATTGVNSVDNVEQVSVESPAAGAWVARLTGTSIQGSQIVAMVTSSPLARIFSDGFESGNTSAWSVTTP